MELDYKRIDPDLLPALDLLPPFDITRESVADIRRRLTESMPPIPMPHLLHDKETISTPDGDLDIHVYRKSETSGEAAVLWIHGGGYLLGSAEDGMAQQIAERCDCTVFSVDYRLAPEHPFPAGPNDCYAALRWMMSGNSGYGFDTGRVVIGGASAGSGMTAGVVLMNRDLENFPLKLQLLLYPMIDNLHATPSGRVTNHPVWNRATSLRAWAMYLNGEPGEDASPYAAASRATNLEGLPPAYVCVGTEDLFRDENIDYARRLNEAGVATELAVLPGLYHGADALASNAAVSKRMREGYFRALEDALAA